MDPLVALVGPTASGKTAVAIALARVLGAEIVSADAVAVYRGLDIGAAKPDAAERAAAVFHCIDIAEPSFDFSVHDYVAAAESACADIRRRGLLPLIAGGTGLYVRPMMATLSLPPVAPNPEVRGALILEAESIGVEALHARLARVDPPSAARIHPGDLRRIVRALEVHAATGRPMSEFHTPEGVHGIPRPGAITVGLERTPDDLARRIAARVVAMLEAGFEDEVRALLEAGFDPKGKALSSLGYRHLIQYLVDGRPLSEVVAELERDTRRYAKRQRSWFRNDPSVRWVEVRPDEPPAETAGRIADLLHASGLPGRFADDPDERG
ncbi:MAG: tRNA (adenosine(37)-N6)-dimethylallyltransferase MiaA [Armatimonadota bacterium]